MNNLIKENLVPLFVIIGGSVLLLISFGIRHSFGLYLLPISNYLDTGRELFGFAAALSQTLDPDDYSAGIKNKQCVIR